MMCLLLPDGCIRDMFGSCFPLKGHMRLHEHVVWVHFYFFHNIVVSSDASFEYISFTNDGNIYANSLYQTYTIDAFVEVINLHAAKRLLIHPEAYISFVYMQEAERR